MTEPLDSQRARLELNARGHHFDEHLDRCADLIDTDYQAFTRLPVVVQDRASLYRDFRQHYRDAVSAGAIADDRGPGSQKETSTW